METTVQTGFCDTHYLYHNKNNGDDDDGDFLIEELLDFPNEDIIATTADTANAGIHQPPGFNTTPTTTKNSSSPSSSPTSSSDSSSAPAVPESQAPPPDNQLQLGDDFGVPLEDLAELEWLSNFVEESFSTNNLPGFTARPEEQLALKSNFQPEASRPSPILHPEVSVPAKARSKRSRTAPGNWTSRLLAVSSGPPPPLAPLLPVASSSTADSSEVAVAPPKKAAKRSKKETPNAGDGEGRRCLHCATDKTPQWRTGPMGPKTLCNACGVRYKSGRLVPEYRPAASPTFVMTKHSNSHRKVLELRRQKEMAGAQPQPPMPPPLVSYHHHHHHQGMMFDAPSNGEDYLIHQHLGPDFRQLI
ncbi:GATA transcription factor 12-like [Andrographis paniculata]|uniref:GATA transcription factor 12-like n=1 Tax=Andrographis paniculata TaxID=175694 RepID=UPI0021E8B35B|nr:GATA transcription factor 12-like [Andrographis paniculata]